MTTLHLTRPLAPMLLGMILLPLSLQAASKTYLIVPEESMVTLSGQAISLDIKAQGTGSLTSHFQGAIRAEQVGNTIQFLEGSVIDAITNGNWEPLPGGASGSAPADYGGLASSFLGTAKAAVREVKLDLMSTPVPLTNGTFDASRLVFFFPTNSTTAFDYRISSLLLAKEGSEPLAGYSTNKVAGGASIVSSSGTETLTIPIDAEFQFDLLAPSDTRIKLQGKFVARSSPTSSLKIDSIVSSNRVVTLRWSTEPGTTYRVESSPDLKNWTIRENALLASTSVLTWSTNVSGATEFYRIGR